MDMVKRTLLIGLLGLLLTLPFTAWAADFSGKVYENGVNDNPVAVPGVKVEVFGGFGFKALFSSATTGTDGGCVLKNVPLGKEVLVRLTKPGYVTQYDIRSYSDTGQDVVLWTGSNDRINGMYTSLGEAFDPKKGNVYLDISNELSGEGIEGVQFAVSSGKVFDLGGGEYLIANAEGGSVTIDIQKPGYAFDIESATIPLFAGGITQYYIAVQSDAGITGSVGPNAITNAPISGMIKTASGAPISCASIAFTDNKGNTIRPAVHSKPDGTYIQTGFPVKKSVRVTPTKTGFRFSPKFKSVTVKATTAGSTANFKAIPD
jgi:hypothetical protein